jgi:hypothetical protein
MSSIDSLPPLHPPGRSRTRAAWSALSVLLLFFLLFFSHAFLLRLSVRSLLWILQPMTGVTMKAEKMQVAWGKPIRWHQVTIDTGKAPFATQLTFQDLSLELSSLSRLVFGDHLLIRSLQATCGHGIIDLRSLAKKNPSVWEKTLSSFASLLSRNLELLPASLCLGDLSFLLLTEGERYSINHLSCTLPNKLAGQLAYQSILIEAGKVHCHLAAARCKGLWNGKRVTLQRLQLATDMMVHELTMAPHRERIDLGVVAELFEGLLRADGSLHHTAEGTFIDSALLVEQLPLGALSHFLGLQKNLSGMIREGRVTFRGLLLHPLDAEASLRMLADNIRLEKSGGVSLAITANLIGRKISLTDFQLKQHENRVAASGEATLTEEWNNIGQAPFLLKLKANIADASRLADLFGTSWNTTTGKIFADGMLHGADHRAEGYLNLQGTAMTIENIPLHWLQLQLLFQGERTDLTNLDIWSGSDHFQCSGVVDNRWPHHYEGRATVQSSDLSEKLIPLLRHCCATMRETLIDPFSLFPKEVLQGGALEASWKGYGEMAHHEGSFHFTLKNLLVGSHRVSGDSSGSYGPSWLSLPDLTWEEGLSRYSAPLLLSSCGIDLKKFLMTEDGVTTLAGDLSLPLDATRLLHQPFSFSQILLRDLPLAVHLQAHDWKRPRCFYTFPWNLLPSLLDGTLDVAGPLETPSLHLDLVGRGAMDERGVPKMRLQLSSEKGEGRVDLSLVIAKNRILQLQGRLPVGATLQSEHTPLKEQEYWQLSPPTAPLDLQLSLPSLSLDEMIAHYCAPFFHAEKTLLSGNLSCKGTWSQPEPSGELSFQAESVKISEEIAPLRHLQGRFRFDKDKMKLSEATALIGRESVTASGSTEWHHQKQEYHLSGRHLPLYQSPSISATGDLDLQLQGENRATLLSGNISLQEIQGPSRIVVTPFLIPPGIDVEPLPSVISNSPSPWKVDIAITTPPETMATSSSHRSIGNVALHLIGDLLSPTLEGGFTLQHLPIVFPRASMTLLQGACSFDSSLPWQPLFQLTASRMLEGNKISATLSRDGDLPLLELQSDPFLSPTRVALELALDNEGSPQEEAAWLTQLPYFLREESFNEPTTLLQPSPATNGHESHSNLGFNGCSISYHAELK